MKTKFFCNLFIICLMPQYVLSMEQIFGKVLATVCNPLGSFRDCILDLNNPHFHQIACVLEYILEKRIVQTELYAEPFYGRWFTFRRISPNDEIKDLKIHKSDMLIHYVDKLKNIYTANKKTDECFSMNKNIFNEEGNLLSMDKLFSLTENHIVLPNEWGTKLDSLQKCMLNFLMNSKLYKHNNIKPILLDDLEDETNEEEAILRAYKLKNNPNVVLQWKWGAEKPKPEETIYEEGDDGFKELKKCEQFELVIKKNNGSSSSSKHLESHHSPQHHAAEKKRKGKMVAHEKEKIDALELLKYFNEEQLFIEEFENIIYFDENKIKNKNIPEKCAICLEDFVKNKKMEHLYCGHYFHWDCMQENRRKNNYKCPLCRANLDGSKDFSSSSLSVQDQVMATVFKK